MSELKPNVKEMLEVGQACGLTTLEESYMNYVTHYDMFFLISKLEEQMDSFVKELSSLKFTYRDSEGIFRIMDMTIEQALTRLGE